MPGIERAMITAKGQVTIPKAIRDALLARVGSHTLVAGPGSPAPTAARALRPRASVHPPGHHPEASIEACALPQTSFAAGATVRFH
jgi:hypothetical protein